jgi:hypothetical protein
MKRWPRLFCLSLAMFAVFLPVVNVSAIAPSSQPKGLFITPIRQYLNVTAGKTASGEFTVGNLNDTPMKVDLSVEQFSLADYTYDYKFNAPKEDWVKISKTQLDLAPMTSKKITYTISAPVNASPGGHYFSIFASTEQGTNKQIRTALVLYATVNGDLKKSSQIVSDSLPSFAISGPLPLHMDIKNTGNTHFFVYASGTLSGWFYNQKGTETAHILLPQTIRSVDTTIQTPLLPGVYKATYGYRNEEGKYTMKQKYVAYAPIWSLVAIVGIIWLAIVLLLRRKRLKKATGS